MRFKSLAAVLIAIGMMIEITAQAAVVFDDPEYDQSNTSVRLTGTIDNYAEKPVSIVILPIDKDTGTLSDSDLPNDAQMTVTNENGDFDTTIYLPENMPSGRYNAVISGEFEDSGIYKEFSYISEAEASDVITAINRAGSIFELEQVFTDENLIKLAITQDEYEMIKNRLLTAIIERDSAFANAGEFYDFYYSTLAMYLMNNGQVEEALEKYRANLGIDIADYRALDSKQKTEFERLLTGYNYENAIFTEVYKENIILAKVRTAEKWSDLKQYVTESAEILDISIQNGSKYANLSDKDAVFREMFKQDMNTFDDIKAEFDDAVSTQQALENKNNAASSSGGGGIGYSSIPSASTNTSPSAKPANPSTTDAEIFNDISDHWAKSAIETMYRLGIISGYPDGSFGPDKTITRAEFAEILANKLGKTSGTEPFSDVSETDWYYSAVVSLYNRDIIHGDGDSFRPMDNIKREDAAVMLYNMLSKSKEMASGALSFNDAYLIDDYAVEAISALSAAGILNGDDSGNINPQNVATRAEAVTMIMNVEDFLAKNDDTVPDDDSTVSEAPENIVQEAVDMIASVGSKSFNNIDIDNSSVITEGEFIIYLTAAIGLVPELDEAEAIDRNESEQLEAAAEEAGLIPENYNSEQSLTLSAAMEVCIRAANYYQYASMTHMMATAVADKLKLYKNLNTTGNAVLTYGDAFILIENLLRADYMKYEYDGKTYRPMDDGETVLSYYRDIYYTDSILTANPYTSMSSEDEKTGDGSVKIGTDIYEADRKFYSMLGQNLTIYYKEGDLGERILLYAVPNNYNNIATVDGSDVDSLRDNNLYYYENNMRLKRYSMDKSVYFIYNGVAYNDYSEDDCKPQSGYVTLIDNNNDYVYDIISVTSYEYMFVDSIDTISSVITENGSNAIDLSDDSINSIFWSLDRNNNYYEVKMYDFCTNVPVRIQASKNGELISFYEIDYISGAVTAVGPDAVSIDGVAYELAEKIYGTSSLKLNYQGLFVCDDSGKVVYFYHKTDETSYRYGYLMNIYRGDDGEEICLKLYDESGKSRSFILGPKIKLDGLSSTRENVYKCFYRRKWKGC